MKRILIFLIIFSLFLPLLAFPASAENEAEETEAAEINDVNEEEKDEEDDEEKDEDEENVFGFLGKLFKGFSNLFNVFKDVKDLKPTLESGGFNFIKKESRLNLLISEIYEVLYPIGFITMLLCWGFGVAKSTISSSLDIKDRNSIIHGVLSLIIGLAAMSLAPQILTTLTGVSQWLCSLVDATAWLTWDNWEIVSDITLSDLLYNTGDTTTALVFVTSIVEYVFMLNILWIALLQCLSPIFIGLTANQSTRKISFNFIREYLKAILLPAITLIYYKLAAAFLWDLDRAKHSALIGIVGAIVLGIATVSVAGKKLDKLIN